MAITVEQAKEIISDFLTEYKSGYNLDFRVRNTQEELYGNQATKAAVGIILGAFYSGESEFHRGRCDISAANHANEEDLRATLRHELLGHFGINTFNSAEKRAILDAIKRSHSDPGIKNLKNLVTRSYPNASPDLHAEEVFCSIAETSVVPLHSLNAEHFKVMSKINDVTQEVTVNDVKIIANHVAFRMQFPDTKQLTFPDNAMKRIEIEHSRSAGRNLNDTGKMAQRFIDCITSDRSSSKKHQKPH